MNWQDFVNVSLQYANQIVTSPIFHQYGLLVLFIYVALPTDVFPIPLEVFIIPLLLNHIDIQQIFLVAWVGEIFGSLGLYFLVKHGVMFVTKIKEPKTLEKSHFLHKYRYVFFSLAPVIYFTGDAMMVVAGLKHVKVEHFIVPLSIGIFFRTLIGVLISLGIIHLPSLIT